MEQYLDALRTIQNRGSLRGDRTGTGTLGVFAHQMRFKLADGFPIVTTKKVSFHNVKTELLWMLRGDRNIRYLVERGVNIWNEWPYRHYLQMNQQKVPDSDTSEWTEGIKEFAQRIKSEDQFAQKWGDLGPVYGYQWRHWPDGNGGEIDQIANAIDAITNTPNSRRIIVNAWNVADIDDMTRSGLPPCHLLFQFHVQNGKLNCHLTQRSADMFLGVPYNISSYALLTYMMAQVTGLIPGELVIEMVDAHIYLNHMVQVNVQLDRKPHPLPTLVINQNVQSLFDFTEEDLNLEGYTAEPFIKASIAV